MNELAINGGEPLLPDGLETEWPVFDEREKEALVQVLESGKWCSASFYFEGEGDRSRVEKFEKDFANFIGTKYATAVPNGTQALELALRAIGLRPGEEVIVSAATFISSASGVVLANGVPVFVDIDPETYQMAPEAVEEAITEKTKAIEAVHYGGYPANMDRIKEIAQEHDLFVIEDAAEAHGSEWRGKRVGSLGDVGCFSLQLGKPLTCGEGGVVTYDDEEIAKRIRSYAGSSGGSGGEEYDGHIPTGNYRLSEFLAAILLSQLPRLEEQTEIRDEHGRYFAQKLKRIKGLSALKRDPRVTKRGYYFYFLRYDSSQWEGVDRDHFLEALRAEGVPCGTAHNDPLYQNPAFSQIERDLLHGHEMDYSQVHCPETERIYDSEVVALSKDFLLQRNDVDKVLEALKKLRGNVGELKGSYRGK